MTLWLPEADPADLAAAPALPHLVRQAVAPSARVLLVDDDAMVRQVLAGQLEELGYHVAQASDGLAALARLDAGEEVDLLVTDFSMPGMNGLLLIDEARHRRPDLPALLLTGYADDTVRFDQEWESTTALLRKPIIDAELADRAAFLLRSRAAARES